MTSAPTSIPMSVRITSSLAILYTTAPGPTVDKVNGY